MSVVDPPEMVRGMFWRLGVALVSGMIKQRQENQCRQPRPTRDVHASFPKRCLHQNVYFRADTNTDFIMPSCPASQLHRCSYNRDETYLNVGLCAAVCCLAACWCWCCIVARSAKVSIPGVDRSNGFGGVMRASRGEWMGRSGGVLVALWMGRVPLV